MQNLESVLDLPWMHLCMRAVFYTEYGVLSEVLGNRFSSFGFKLVQNTASIFHLEVRC